MYLLIETAFTYFRFRNILNFRVGNVLLLVDVLFMQCKLMTLLNVSLNICLQMRKHSY